MRERKGGRRTENVGEHGEWEKLVWLAWQLLPGNPLPERRTLGCFFDWDGEEGSWITLKSTSFKAAASRV